MIKILCDFAKSIGGQSKKHNAREDRRTEEILMNANSLIIVQNESLVNKVLNFPLFSSGMGL